MLQAVEAYRQAIQHNSENKEAGEKVRMLLKLTRQKGRASEAVGPG
jgi:hypothetical protein